jgi:uncharacterized protein
MRAVYLVSGLVSVGLGILGAFLPVMPSTCFFILGAYFFGKSSHRLECWILNHPTFGPTVRAWRTHKAMSRSAKVAAYIGMSIGQAMLLTAWPGFLWITIGSAIIVTSAVYIWTRPTYSSECYRFNGTNLD